MTQKITGIQRFSHEMCRALASKGYDITVLAPRNIRDEYKLAYKIHRFGILKGALWEHIELPLFLLRHRRPLLISFGSPGPLFYKNRIVTIHDVSFYYHPHWFSKLYGLYYRLVTPLIARFSRRILTVSQFSKKEIMRWLNLPDEKIAVVHNAVSRNIINRKAELNEPEERYILTVCSMDPRKNLGRTIKGYKLSGIEKTVRMKAAGGGSSLFKMTKTPEIQNIALGYVSDQEL
ncbi:MAG: glycosyltransferase, partial [Bacteroidales bacterium]